jgi:hypothetical protein
LHCEQFLAPEQIEHLAGHANLSVISKFSYRQKKKRRKTDTLALSNVWQSIIEIELMALAQRH